MGRSGRVRARGVLRKHPDAAIIAHAIIQLARELKEKERIAELRANDEPKDSHHNEGKS